MGRSATAIAQFAAGQRPAGILLRDTTAAED